MNTTHRIVGLEEKEYLFSGRVISNYPGLRSGDVVEDQNKSVWHVLAVFDSEQVLCERFTSTGAEAQILSKDSLSFHYMFRQAYLDGIKGNVRQDKFSTGFQKALYGRGYSRGADKRVAIAYIERSITKEIGHVQYQTQQASFH